MFPGLPPGARPGCAFWGCRQSPRRHIQTRDAADGEKYQVVHTDPTNILIRLGPRAVGRHAMPARLGLRAGHHGPAD
jgi:hypothetical protein